MNQYRYRANAADATSLPDDELDDAPDGGIKKPLILVVLLHVIAVAGLLVFANFNAQRSADTGDANNDFRYTEAADPPASEDTYSLEAVGAALPQEDPADNRPITHVVRGGEMLPSIARHYGVDVQELARVNHLTPSDILSTGRVLKLPQTAAASALMAGGEDFRELMSNAPRATPTTTPAQLDGMPVMRAEPAAAVPPGANVKSGTTYTIKSGDTLSKIARENGTTAQALMKANEITDPTRIRPGQELKIP